MNFTANKSSDSRKQIQNNDTGKIGTAMGSTFQFVDNRPEALVQRKLKAMTEQSLKPTMGDQPQAIHFFNTASHKATVQKKENKTGLPIELKEGIEHLSGYSMDDVKVHRNSDKPAQLQAHAFAQGTDIHLASGKEKHLPHEAWHVVQQKQGRVKPTLQMKGKVKVNDDAGLEKEADVMGMKALHSDMELQDSTLQYRSNTEPQKEEMLQQSLDQGDSIVQRKVIARIRTSRISQELPRVISEIRIEGRAPTTVKGAQGDHTVAETLINESVKREVMHQQPKVALNNLMVLASLTLPQEGEEIIKNDFFDRYWNQMDAMDGEDKNTVIEEMIQRYIELANKREATAFLRDQELTRGNKGERKAIGGVRELADKLEQGQGVNTNDMALVASNLAQLIDMRYVNGQQDRYTMVILRAVQHAVLSVLPQLSQEQIYFMLGRLMAVELGPRDNIDTVDQNSILENVIGQLY